MAKGSIGTNTGTIIYTRGRRRTNEFRTVVSHCKKCIHAVVNQDGVANCMITGDVAVNKRYCEFYKNKKKIEQKQYKRRRKATRTKGMK